MKTPSTGPGSFFLELSFSPSLSLEIENPQVIEVSNSFSSEND
jgi:hypothetical protein